MALSWHVYKLSNISEAAKIASSSRGLAIFRCYCICVYWCPSSHTPGIKEEQEKESRIPTCKIQTATGDMSCVASSRSLEGLPFQWGIQRTCFISSPTTPKQQ